MDSEEEEERGPRVNNLQLFNRPHFPVFSTLLVTNRRSQGKCVLAVVNRFGRSERAILRTASGRF